MMTNIWKGRIQFRIKIQEGKYNTLHPHHHHCYLLVIHLRNRRPKTKTKTMNQTSSIYYLMIRSPESLKHQPIQNQKPHSLARFQHFSFSFMDHSYWSISTVKQENTTPTIYTWLKMKWFRGWKLKPKLGRTKPTTCCCVVESCRKQSRMRRRRKRLLFTERGWEPAWRYPSKAMGRHFPRINKGKSLNMLHKMTLGTTIQSQSQSQSNPNPHQFIAFPSLKTISNTLNFCFSFC